MDGGGPADGGIADPRLRPLAQADASDPTGGPSGAPASPTGHGLRPVTDSPRLLAWLRGSPPGSTITRISDVIADRVEVDQLQADGHVTSLTTPIVLPGGEPWGLIRAARGPSRSGFDETDLHLADVAAGMLAAGLAQSRRIQALQVLAWSDPLTGLANRRLFDDRLTALLGAGDREQVRVTVAVADVNDLKEINDRYGHETGDTVLQMIADHARDTVADLPGAVAARLGGDEFALLLPGIGPRRAYRMAAAWCSRVADDPARTTLACGLATLEPSTDADQPASSSAPAQQRAHLIRSADAAAYHAKRTGSPYPVIAGPER
jgi:diguanylate cyclase (GGDEF)-like protein